MVFDPISGKFSLNEVTRFKLHFRPAEYSHIMLGNKQFGRNIDSSPGLTLVWHKPVRRDWGFWTVYAADIYGRWKDFKWVPWDKYLYS
jgi:hypothetical protein